MLKTIRDVIADLTAEIVGRAPIFEPGFIAAGQLLSRFPQPVPRLYWRSVATLAARLRAEGRSFRQLDIGPTRLWFDVSTFTARDLYFSSQPYEWAITAWMADHLEAGATVVDVGANSGYHTIIAASLVGEGGHVFAFEPHPLVAKELREHIRRNGFDRRITTVDLALADEAARGVDFYASSSGFNTGTSSLIPTWERVSTEGRRMTVDTETFDNWRRGQDLRSIDLIKIDAEGAEDRVVRGMRETLAQAPPAHIIIETDEASEAYRTLGSAGYDATVLERVSELSNLLFSYRR